MSMTSNGRRVGAARVRCPARKRPRGHRHAVERLESRLLLAFAPVGPEFRVNTYTTAPQNYPAVATDADGDFVVAWESLGQDGDGYGVYAQRFNPAGTALGAEFRVNTYTAGDQRSVAVATDADGDFVVAWTSNGQDGSGDGVFARRYNAAGTPLGGEFRVNTYTTNAQFAADLVMDADGNLVIAWSGEGPDGPGQIYAQRYNVEGEPVGAQFRANTSSDYAQTWPAVAAAADGRFVIAWRGGSIYSSDIFAQRYNAAGQPAGPEFRVNTTTPDVQTLPEAAMDAGGDFVIAWSGSPGGDAYDVFAQRYSAAGAPLGGEFRLNVDPAGDQRDAAVAMDAAGNFVTTWYSGDGDSLGVFGRQYTAAGAPVGAEFRTNTYTAGAQWAGSPAMDADGDTVIAWASAGQDGNSAGVYAQRYDESADAAGPIVSDVAVAGQRLLPGATLGTPVRSITVTVSEQLSTVGGPTGFNSATNPANWRLLRGATDVSSSIGSVSFGLNPDTRKYEAVLSFPQGLYAAGNYSIATRPTLRDAVGNSFDGDRDGQPGGGDWSRAFVLTNAAPITPGLPGVSVQEDAANTVVPLAGAFSDQEQPSAELTYSLTLNTNPALFSSTAISASADTVTLDYAPNASGQSTLTVRATDAGGLFAEATFTVTVAPVNDAPTTTGLPPVTAVEDAASTLVSLFPAFADIEDPDDALTYTIATDTNPSLFTSTMINGSTGVLALDYAPDASGTASLTVRATDGGGLYAQTAFTVQVTPVNDAPTTTGILPVNVAEDAPDTTIRLFDAFSDLEDWDRDVAYTIRSNTNPALFDATAISPSTGYLILDFAADAGGTATLTVRATDRGGLFVEAPLVVTVNPVNDPPVNDVPAMQYARPGRPWAFGREFGNAIAVSDVDAGREEVRVTLSAAEGFTLEPGPVEGVKVEQPDRNVLRLTGELRAVNAAMDGLRLVPPLGFEERETSLGVTSDDLGHGGAGGPLQDADEVLVAFYRPPRVDRVFVSAWTWGPAFVGALAAAGLGDVTYGYAVPAGAAQLAALPWAGLSVVGVRFGYEGPLSVAADDLTVRDAGGAARPVAGFEYRAADRTAVWFLERPAANDRLTLELAAGAGGVAGAYTGVPMDGEWADGADAWPSGDGTPGGGFRFSLNVLAGDVTRDGRVNALDALDVRRRMRRTAAAPGPAGPTAYTIFHDVDGDAATTARDVLAVRRATARAPALPLPPAGAATSALREVPAAPWRHRTTRD